MKEFFLLMYDANAENGPHRFWNFELNGLQKSVTIKVYSHGGKFAPVGGTFYLDQHGTPAACSFIRKNLKP